MTDSAQHAASTTGLMISVRTSLHYFNIYRFIVASVFLFAAAFYSRTSGLGAQNLKLHLWTNLVYWLSAILFYAGFSRWRFSINRLLTIEVIVDVLAITLMMYASGGAKSGLAVMMLITLAGAGLVGQGTLALFYAALATLAILFEQTWRYFFYGADLADFMQTGLVAIAFFATSVSARLLAHRVIANEELARQRGIDLANQLFVNERIIRDMQDGVMVVNHAGKVRQWNPQAESLLGMRGPDNADLASFSLELAEQHRAFHDHGLEQTVCILQLPGGGARLRVRFIHAGSSGDVLVYLEDMSRIQQQAQQIKLAALGRLTANIAHEIRNPLSAISHAAELLREEKRADGQERLSRIINDNTSRLERLVRDVLELGRRDKMSSELIRLPSFLNNFLDEMTLHDQVNRAIFQLVVEADTGLLFDRAHLHQVLWNLLSNALRYCSGQPGAIKIVVREVPALKRTELHIIDDGAGIDPEEQSKVFEPFFTTYGKGTGLGLYIARELSEANDALLELAGNNPGAHFRIIGRNQLWQENRNEEIGRG